MKHLFARIAALFVFASMSLAASAANELKLVSVRSNGCSTSGCTSAQPFMRATLDVQNIAYVKHIGVRYRNTSGAWVSQPGEYMKSVGNNRELWAIDLWETATEFAFYYTVNGVTYWDNNGGRNYRTAPHEYDAIIGSGVNITEARGFWVSPTGTPTGQGYVWGDILVRTQGPWDGGRTVKVVYTTDNWQTTRTANASYAATLPSGVELWNYNAPTGTASDYSKLRLAFQYNWQGGSAWDNNYGLNYGVMYYGFLAR